MTRFIRLRRDDRRNAVLARSGRFTPALPSLVNALCQVTGRGEQAMDAGSASRFPDSHAELMLEVIDAVRAAFGESGLGRLLHERTQRQKDPYARRMKKAGAGLLRRAQALAEIPHEQGYMADCQQRRDAAIPLIENHCPICAAASSCQARCREE